MNLDDFSTTVDDMRYINPQVGLDESNAFIENLRATQGQRTQEIAEDTYNLGTAVPSNLGGLGGAGTYFTSRYQTPQTNDAIANLRTAAQMQALTSAMNNLLGQAKQRYAKAYKSYQKRHNKNPSTNPINPINPTNPKGLTFDTNPDSNSTFYVNPNTNTGEGFIENVGGQTQYTKNGKVYGIRTPNAGEYAQNKGTFDTMKPADGYSYTRNGKTYMYINNGKQPSGWYVVTGVK